LGQRLETEHRPKGLGRGLVALAVIASLLVGASLILGAWLLGRTGTSGEPSGSVPAGAEGGTPTVITPVPASLAFPRDGDLTMGGEAGEVLVGLTLRPAEPGLNEVLVYVLPLEGERQAERLPVTLSVGDRRVTAASCGPTCRNAELELGGGEQVQVRVGGRVGGTDLFQIPELPAPDGSELFSRMQQRMHDLERYRVQETLSSGRATVRADYAFEAPDRMRTEVDSGSERILVGKREWSRNGPARPWRGELGIKPKVPRYVWDGSDQPIAATVLGTEQAAGRPATVVSFFGGTATPIWFRLWIDDAGLVHRAEMRAQGHFMDHRYFAFDAPFHIVPPRGDR
jgi:hypothetical protein